MRVIIAGSRIVKNYSLVKRVIKESNFKITEIISGEAPGVDKLGERYSKEILGKEPKIFEAEWTNIYHPDAVIRTNSSGRKYDASAGHRRNEKMANYADALIVIIKDNSKGSMDMLQIAQKKGLKIHCEFI